MKAFVHRKTVTLLHFQITDIMGNWWLNMIEEETHNMVLYQRMTANLKLGTAFFFCQLGEIAFIKDSFSLFKKLTASWSFLFPCISHYKIIVS